MFGAVIRRVESTIRRHLAWIHRVTWHYPGRTIFISLFLLLLAFGSIATTRFESDIFKLFPAEKGPLRLFLDTLSWTGSSGEAYFILEGERERLVPEAEAFAARLKEIQVDGQPGFRRVAYRTVDPDELGPFARFLQYAVLHPQLFLYPSDAPRYVEALTPQSMDRAIKRAGTELAAASGMGVQHLVAADPLYLRDLILPRLKEASQALDLDPESPYFISRDGKLLIIIAEPARPVQEMEFARKLVEGINRARAGAGVSISCAGAHLSAVIDEAVMKRNIISCIVSSLFVVLGLFLLTYRRVMPMLLIPLIILFGTALALGLAGLFLPSIHIISFAFTALIIGLGTDYSIHLYDRFYCERSGGRPTEEALRLAITDTGQGVFTAATTTALPFLALTVSDVRALSELGLLVCLGVLFSMYATFFFLPPLLRFAEGWFPGRGYRPLPSFGLGTVWRMTGRLKGPVIIGTVAIVVLGAVASFFISFEGELKNLQPRHSEAFLTQERIERHLTLAPKQMIVAVEGAEPAEVMARGARVGELAEAFRQRGQLAAVSWLGQVLNVPPIQDEVLSRLSQGLDGPRTGKALSRVLEENGFEPGMFDELITGLNRLSRAEAVPVAHGVEQLRSSPFKGIAERFLIERDGSWHLLMYLHYTGSEFPQEAFLHQLATVDPGARATGTDLISRQLSQSVRNSFATGFLIGGVLVLFLLVSHFKSATGIFAALFPVVGGVTAMLGLMVATGMKFNFMNSMVLVTIVGMGSDYGLHIFHRVGGIAGDEAEERFIQAGRAVLLSALTTIAGFGSLAFTDYGAMSSIGWATNYGVGATALFSLISLPAFLFLFRVLPNSRR